MVHVTNIVSARQRSLLSSPDFRLSSIHNRRAGGLPVLIIPPQISRVDSSPTASSITPHFGTQLQGTRAVMEDNVRTVVRTRGTRHIQT